MTAVTCIALAILLTVCLPLACLMLLIFYSEGQSKRRDGEAYTEDLFYGDDAETPREFRGLTGRMKK